MSRKNLYDIVEEQVVSAAELWQQIYGLYTREPTLNRSYYSSTTVNSFEGLFNKEFMKSDRMNSLRIKFNRDYNSFYHELFNPTFEETNVVGTGNSRLTPKATFDTIYTFTELLYFMFPDTDCSIEDFEKDSKEYDADYEFYENLNEIKKVIDYALEISNHEIDEIDGKRLVVTSKPEVTQAVEIITDTDLDLSLKLLEYNRFSSGLQEKRDLLKLMANSVEKIVKQSTNDNLKSDYGYLANNFLDIRHPETASGLTDEKTEKWYDKLYALIIAIIVDLDYQKIHTEIAKTKRGDGSGNN